MQFVIYGAQGYALGAYNAIRKLHPEIVINCFLVTKMESNPSSLGGIPVRELDDYTKELSREEKNNIGIFIGTPENVMGAIEECLEAAGLFNHVRLDSIRWADLQEKAFIKTDQFMPLSTYPLGFAEADMKVCKMLHCKDKTLSTEYIFPAYMMDVQVGAAGSGRKIASVTDLGGDNISDRNGNYSELTGLYWMWKNLLSESKRDDVYYGLAHYRRYLVITDDDRSRLVSNSIDVVLPYPMPYEPNIEAHHHRYITALEWRGVLQALNEMHLDYLKELESVIKQGYLYNYNIIIAKKRVLSDYCEWLFPLLFRIEEINNPDGKKEPNRYLGYVGETLETLYFMYNKQKLRIAHTGCRFLV